MGLGHALDIHGQKFGGVLNGIDYDVWNPEIDRFIPARYTPKTLDQKYANKDALRDRLWLRKDFKPIIAYVGRIDRQKGLHLIHHAIFHSLARGAQFVPWGVSAVDDQRHATGSLVGQRWAALPKHNIYEYIRHK